MRLKPPTKIIKVFPIYDIYCDLSGDMEDFLFVFVFRDRERANMHGCWGEGQMERE